MHAIHHTITMPTTPHIDSALRFLTSYPSAGLQQRNFKRTSSTLKNMHFKIGHTIALTCPLMHIQALLSSPFLMLCQINNAALAFRNNIGICRVSTASIGIQEWHLGLAFRNNIDIYRVSTASFFLIFFFIFNRYFMRILLQL